MKALAAFAGCAIVGVGAALALTWIAIAVTA